MVCECGFIADRQFVGAFNVWMWGMGGEIDDLLLDEPGGEFGIVSPKPVVMADLNERRFSHLSPKDSRRTDLMISY